MKKPPCVKNGVPCDKRYPGCQDRCKDMAEVRAYNDVIRAGKAKQRVADEYLADSCMRMMKRKK